MANNQSAHNAPMLATTFRIQAPFRASPGSSKTSHGDDAGCTCESRAVTGIPITAYSSG
jgi:hypothetical protein